MKVILSICENTRSDFSKEKVCNNLFGIFKNHEIYVLGDNLSDTLVELIVSLKPTYFENKTRGRKQWMVDKINFCIDTFKEEDELYLVEDDYFHLENSDVLISEGLKHSEYVTLYDHPDKYGQHPHKNPEITSLGESTMVFLTKHSHWKYTNSTTGTFACLQKTLSEDSDVWLKSLQHDGWWDYLSFIELRKRNRKIATCIPGKSTHLHSLIMYSPFFPTDI